MRRPVTLWLTLTILTAVFQLWWLATLKLPSIAPEHFGARFVGLGSVGPWQIGYAMGHHGAVFGRGTVVPAGVTEDSCACAGVDDFMRREYVLLPARASLEVGLYSAIVALGIALWRSRPRSRRLRRAWAASSPVLLTVLATLPLLAWCYGESLYSTFEGPCPMSYSGGYLTLTFIPADTISYRTFLEAVLWLPANLARSSRAGYLLRLMPGWLSLYLVTGCAYAACCLLLDSMSARILRLVEQRRNS